MIAVLGSPVQPNNQFNMKWNDHPPINSHHPLLFTPRTHHHRQMTPLHDISHAAWCFPCTRHAASHVEAAKLGRALQNQLNPVTRTVWSSSAHACVSQRRTVYNIHALQLVDFLPFAVRLARSQSGLHHECLAKLSIPATQPRLQLSRPSSHPSIAAVIFTFSFRESASLSPLQSAAFLCPLSDAFAHPLRIVDPLLLPQSRLAG